jgi:uncharacterized protein YegP (UPF0339 family)
MLYVKKASIKQFFEMLIMASNSEIISDSEPYPIPDHWYYQNYTINAVTTLHTNKISVEIEELP